MPMAIETIRRLWNETLEAFAETGKISGMKIEQGLVNAWKG